MPWVPASRMLASIFASVAATSPRTLAKLTTPIVQVVS